MFEVDEFTSQDCICHFGIYLHRSLAHLYHYYLHGEQGNISNPAQTMRHDAPQLSFECISGRNTIWDCNLAEVNDDLESLYLRVTLKCPILLCQYSNDCR